MSPVIESGCEVEEFREKDFKSYATFLKVMYKIKSV